MQTLTVADAPDEFIDFLQYYEERVAQWKRRYKPCHDTGKPA